MLNKKVAILMSTYNGENYLCDQLDTLKKQTYQKWDLFIRDDGSNDNTLQIIKKYAKEDKRIHLILEKKENMGPKCSFFYLLRQIEADYYFFCDQDDYWKKTKLKSELDILENSTEPCLVYCGLKCVDKRLKPESLRFEKLIGSLEKASVLDRFISNDIPGCVMGFDKKIRDLFLETKEYTHIIMHDWWICLIACSFGRIHFLPEKLVLYRQHEDNTIGAGEKKNIFLKMFDREVWKKEISLVGSTYYQAVIFRNQYKNEVKPEIKHFLEDFYAGYSGNFIYRFIFLIKYKNVFFLNSRIWFYCFVFLFHGLYKI